MFHIDDYNCRWWILGAVGGVLGMIVLDETVVGVALPTIRLDLAMFQVASYLKALQLKPVPNSPIRLNRFKKATHYLYHSLPLR